MVAAQPIAEILGLGVEVQSMQELDIAVNAGLPKRSLELLSSRLYCDVRAASAFKFQVIPPTTWKRRTTRLSQQEVSPTTPISRGIFGRLQERDGSPAFDALWLHGYASVNSLQAILAANALGIPVLLRAESWMADRVLSPWKLVLKNTFFRLLGKGIAAVLPIGTVNAEGANGLNG
jgi:hypothetical protein